MRCILRERQERAALLQLLYLSTKVSRKDGPAWIVDRGPPKSFSRDETRQWQWRAAIRPLTRLEIAAQEDGNWDRRRETKAGSVSTPLPNSSSPPASPYQSTQIPLSSDM